MRRCGLGVAALLAACGGAPGAPRPSSPAGAVDPGAAVSALARQEDEVLGWLAAADPRLAARADVSAPKEMLDRLGTSAVLAEDATVRVTSGSLDLFSFQARERALREAESALTKGGALPREGPAGSEIARPALERELLGRLIAQEAARAADEQRLGASSADLVRGLVATWRAPASPEDAPERDRWLATHLLELRGSLRDAPAQPALRDLDGALYPLERLLGPLSYPRGAAAIAQVRMALDADTRPIPPLESPERLARSLRVHLGVALEPSGLAGALERLAAGLRERAEQELGKGGEAGRGPALSRGRELLFAEATCAPVRASRVRSMAPPPERATVCGALRALTDEPLPGAALAALHDEVLLALAAVTVSPPSRARLLTRPADDVVDALRRMARERPVRALAPALAAEVLSREGSFAERLARWQAVGEAPLDVAARELASPEGSR